MLFATRWHTHTHATATGTCSWGGNEPLAWRRQGGHNNEKEGSHDNKNNGTERHNTDNEGTRGRKTNDEEDDEDDNHKTTMDNEDNHHKRVTGTETETANDTTRAQWQRQHTTRTGQKWKAQATDPAPSDEEHKKRAQETPTTSLGT
jgi:hypothetical protein